MIIRNFPSDNTDNLYTMTLQKERNNKKENGNKSIYKN